MPRWGLAWVKGRQRPFVQWERVGKRKPKVRVYLANGSKGTILKQESIIRFPEGGRYG